MKIKKQDIGAQKIWERDREVKGRKWTETKFKLHRKSFHIQQNVRLRALYFPIGLTSLKMHSERGFPQIISYTFDELHSNQFTDFYWSWNTWKALNLFCLKRWLFNIPQKVPNLSHHATFSPCVKLPHTFFYLPQRKLSLKR